MALQVRWWLTVRCFLQVLQEFLNFTEGLTLVGHNIASFDMKFIWRDAEKYYGELVPNDYVDTLKVARRHLSELPRHRLVDLAEYYGISPEGAHRALNDCRMNQQVYERMVAEIRKKRAIQHEYTGRKAETDNTGVSKTEGNAADRNGIAKQSAKPVHPR
ncbi:MAG: PolC-type DNA polymerase III [Lachnospiraceae bacterium]